MSTLSLEQSLEPGGPHHLLSQLVGEWKGITKTWFEPEVLADESEWVGPIRSVFGGMYSIHEYHGAIMDGPIEGIATFGYELHSERFVMSWIDRFHTGTDLMYATGVRTTRGFNVIGSYFAGDGPRWGWRTEIEIVDADHIVITAYNITPDGIEAKGVETRYERVTP